MTLNKKRILAAIMFTDMVGYTALMQKNEELAKKNRDKHREVLQNSISEHFGEILQYYGDGTLSIFESVIEAVKCAVEIQTELQKEPPVPLRIGIHSGDIVYDEEGVYGDAVNVALRIEGLSISGSVLISEKVMSELKNHPDLTAKSLGHFNLKNVEQPAEIYAVESDNIIVPTSEQINITPSEVKRSSQEWKDKPVKYLRDKVVDQLKYNLAHDHLEIDEFERLVRMALSTQSKTELLSLVTDLPPKDKTAIKNQELKLVDYENKESMINILSASKRKGMWVAPKQLRVLTVLGETEIDFREVRLGPDLSYISLDCWLGAVKIIIPPGVNVVSNVKNILGAMDSRSQGSMNPDSPTIVIEGKVVLGEVTIHKREKAKEIQRQSDWNHRAHHEVTNLPKGVIQKIYDQIRSEVKKDTKQNKVPEKRKTYFSRNKAKFALGSIAIVFVLLFTFHRTSMFNRDFEITKLPTSTSLPAPSSVPESVPESVPDIGLPPFDTTSVKLAKGFCSAPQPHRNYIHCDLDRKNFKNVDLTGSRFDGVDLERANFTGCDLTGVSFKGANLERAVFKGSKLIGNDFSGAEMDRAQFIGTNLSRANFSGSQLERAIFKNIELNEVSMKGALLERANFKGATLNRVDLSSARLQRANFKNAKLDQVVFTDADLEDVDLSRAILKQVIR
ncbi:MAG: hypothetical protein HOD85_35935 [Deltaproteobacteria bacterium]|nr:hypothetical protein [Deltaproteobacteria bacterium]